MTIEANKLRLTPCLPPDWQDFKLRYRYRDTEYSIAVTLVSTLTDTDSKMLITVDGVVQKDAVISLRDDRQAHLVEVQIKYL